MMARFLWVLLCILTIGFGPLNASLSDMGADDTTPIPKIMTVPDIGRQDEFATIFYNPYVEKQNDSFIESQYFYQEFIQKIQRSSVLDKNQAWRNMMDLIFIMDLKSKTDCEIGPFERGVYLSKVGYCFYLLNSNDTKHYALSCFSDALNHGGLFDTLKYAIHEKMFQIYHEQGRHALALRHLNAIVMMNQNPGIIGYLDYYIKNYWRDVIHSFSIEWPVIFLCDWYTKTHQIDQLDTTYRYGNRTLLFFCPDFQKQQGDFYNWAWRTNGRKNERYRSFASFSYLRVLNTYPNSIPELETKIRELENDRPKTSKHDRKPT